MRSRTMMTISVILAIAAQWALSGQCAIATDSPDLPPKQVERIPSSPEEVSRLTWAILHVIDREQINAPSHDLLIDAVAKALIQSEVSEEIEASLTTDAVKATPTHRRIPLDPKPIATQLASCRNVDDFADTFGKIWETLPQRSHSIEVFQSRLIAALHSKLGYVRLLRTNESVVEDQFRNNRYVGLGVALGTEQTNFGFGYVFASIVPDGPADRAGLKDGTHVLKIDGRLAGNMEMNEVLENLRGPVGSEVVLTIWDADSSKPRQVPIKRGVIRFESLHNRNDTPLSRSPMNALPDQPIGWIKIHDITSSTVSELRVAEAKAKSQGLRVMILEFGSLSRHDNLHQARLLADCLLDGGIIWRSTNREGETEVDLADRECLFREMPLVVLVNKQTSPLHCAIAAALQDSGRATIVGTSPHLGCEVATTAPVNGFPYLLALNTIKLTRGNDSRSCPLVPDHKVVEPAPALAEEHHPQALVKLGPVERLLLTAMNIDQKPSPASALSPANNQVAERFSDRWNDVSQKQRERPTNAQERRRRAAKNVEAGEELALRVATDLLEAAKRSSPSADTAESRP